TVGQLGEERLVKLREVAIERAQVPALDEHLAVATKDNRSKPVPFRFVQKSTFREPGGKLREHRLERWRGGQRLLHDQHLALHSAIEPAQDQTSPSLLQSFLNFQPSGERPCPTPPRSSRRTLKPAIGPAHSAAEVSVVAPGFGSIYPHAVPHR